MEQQEIQNALRSRLLGEQPKPPEIKGIVAKPVEMKNPVRGSAWHCQPLPPAL